MNGVHSNVTRDGDRQSRVIDITLDLIQVKTLDHNKRALLDSPDWEYRGELSELVKQKDNIIKSNFIDDTLSLNPSLELSLSLVNQEPAIRIVDDFVTGGGNVIPGGLIYGSNNRIFAATNNGYLWEIDIQYKEALGTLHYNDHPLKGIAVTGNLMWRVWDNKIAVSDLTNPFRFKRERKGDNHKSFCLTQEKPVQCICKKSDTSVLIGYDEMLLEAQQCNGKIILKEICSSDSTISQIGYNSYGIFARTAKGDTYIYDCSGKCIYRGNNEFFADTPMQDSASQLLSLGSLPEIITNNNNNNELIGNFSLLNLSNDRILLLVNEQLFFTGPELHEWKEIYMKGFKAAAISKIPCSGEIDRICVALNALEGDKRPRFQIWEIS